MSSKSYSTSLSQQRTEFGINIAIYGLSTTRVTGFGGDEAGIIDVNPWPQSADPGLETQPSGPKPNMN